jgi:predicted RNA-binding Zn ribbon-like protein
MAGSADAYGAERVPPAAETVLRFVNTRADGAGRPERFGDAEGFAEWASERGPLSSDVLISDSDAASARELRDAIVVLLLAHADDTDVTAAQIAAAERFLRGASARYPLLTIVTRTGVELVAEDAGAVGLLASVLAAVTELAQRGDWAGIKACCNPPCHFGFVDRTRNRSARFCSTGCGSQVSMRAYRARRRNQLDNFD